MRFLTVFAFILASAFAIDGRGLSPQSGEPLPPSSPSTPIANEEIRKANAFKPSPNASFKITKVHEVRTDKKVDSRGNKALEFEQKYWMYGAVTQEQIDAKKGQYFVMSWVNNGAPMNVEARFEYRQVKTKDVIRTFSIRHSLARGANRSQFSVVGKAFEEGGPIQSYRFTLWSGDELLAESKSFIW